MKKSTYWKMFLILLILCVFGVAAIFPYVMTVQKELLKALPIPLNTFFAVQLIQSAILFTIAILIGLKLSKKVNFTIPVLENWLLNKKVIPGYLSTLKISMRFGFMAAIAIAVLDYLFGFAGVKSLFLGIGGIPVWQRFLASFYGGINEEVLMRLFLMTLFIWIGYKLAKVKTESKIIIWVSIFLTSIIFGLGHLPITSSFTELTFLVVARGIILNSIGGIVFGWLYWKKGFEAAVISHFTADIFIQVLIPLILS